MTNKQTATAHNPRNLSVESKTWVDRYVELFTPLSESPSKYHRALAWSVLSSVLTGKISFLQGNDEISPNLWLLLVGDSGTSHKSTALGNARKMLIEVAPERLVPQLGSKEKFISRLARMTTKNLNAAVLVDSEFTSFLASMSSSYNLGAKENLCKLFDGESIQSDTQARDLEVVEKLHLLMIGSTTATFLNEAIQDQQGMDSGFWARFQFVVARGKAERVLPTPPSIDMNKFNELVDDLREISGVSGQAKFTDSANDIYEKFYFEMRKMADKNPNFPPFLTRLQVVAKKIAMLAQAVKLEPGEPNADFWVADESMRIGIEQAKFFMDELSWLLLNEITLSKFDVHRKTILKSLRASEGGVTKRDIQRATRLHTDYLDRVLEQLIQTEEIRKIPIKGKRGRSLDGFCLDNIDE